ncbi:uncharacterized protein LAJ45_11655 [Morchella importuna]|uniref:uncharacterized protein n=1 Tax=Morchella importuna TaxID=1174673 RepID=UPI001E8CD60B|nr:uncharacterized protein LAJ45_11655 [Morchella importuna]KAH8144366.1 hypothetical protein LAJ45_11655 [Morchella importuna]
MNIFLSLLLLLTLPFTLSAPAPAPGVRPDVVVAPKFMTLANTYKKQLYTAPGQSILFYGRPPQPKTGTLQMKDFIMQTYVKKSPGTSLDYLIEHNKLWDKINESDPSERLQWGSAMSHIYTNQASGVVRVLVGANPGTIEWYKSSVFYQFELPELTKAGTKVTQIVMVNAAKLEATKVFWTPGKGHWGKGGKNADKTPFDQFVAPGGASSAGAGAAACKRALGQACKTAGSAKAKMGGGAVAKKKTAAPALKKGRGKV